MIGMGLPEWFADAMGEYMIAFGEGYGNFITDDVQLITGTPARSFEAFAHDFAQVFASEIKQAA